MDQIKYTFLLLAYKPDFLEVALRSIKSQTLKDFKVLVSDDCSPHDLKSIYNKVCGDAVALIDDAKMLNLDGENKNVQFSFDESKENCIFAYN